MTEIVTNMSKIHRVGHIGSCGMPHPVRRRILDHMSETFKLNSAIPNSGGGLVKHLLDDQMHCTSRQ